MQMYFLEYHRDISNTEVPFSSKERSVQPMINSNNKHSTHIYSRRARKRPKMVRSSKIQWLVERFCARLRISQRFVVLSIFSHRPFWHNLFRTLGLNNEQHAQRILVSSYHSNFRLTLHERVFARHLFRLSGRGLLLGVRLQESINTYYTKEPTAKTGLPSACEAFWIDSLMSFGLSLLAMDEGVLFDGSSVDLGAVAMKLISCACGFTRVLPGAFWSGIASDLVAAKVEEFRMARKSGRRAWI